MKKKIKIGIPGGTLLESVKYFFQDAGYSLEIKESPSFVFIDNDDIECFLSGTYESPVLVEKGILDGTITSKAAIAESGCKNVEELFSIGTPYKKWREETKAVIAVSKNSKIKKPKDLQGKKIITRLPGLANSYLKKNKISAQLEVSQGGNEQKVPRLADAVVEFISTGKTFEYYNLRVLDTVLEDANMISLIVNPNSLKDSWKKEKLNELGVLLHSARLAKDYAGLMLHASNDMMEQVFKILPSLKKPTVTHLRGENWFDVFTVAPKSEIRSLIPRLKKIGCTDIVEFPLKKVII